MIKIQVILGTTRQGRFSEKPGKWIFEELQKRGSIGAELVDLRDYDMPFFNEEMSPYAMEMAGKEYVNGAVKKWTDKVAEADGFIIVTGEYNHGYPAVLKNALDWVSKQWRSKPVGFVSYGGAGGARVIEQLRQVVIELGMIPIKVALSVPFQFAPVDPEKFLAQLISFAEVMKPLREK